MKKMVAIALSGMMLMSFTACSNMEPAKNKSQAQESKQVIGGDVEIPSPFHEFKTLTEAETFAGLTITLPTSLPAGYTQKLIEAVEKNMIQIIYQSDNGDMTIRKAKGSEDISGDYNKYTEAKEITIGKLKVKTKGENGKIHNATWTEGNYTYAITDSTGLDSATLSDMINSMNSTGGIGGDVEIPSPFHKFNTLAKAEAFADLTLTLPDKMPAGYTQELIEAVEKDMIQVIYQTANEQLTIRKAKGNEDISGDYNEYSESKSLTVGDKKVATKGNNGNIQVATWTEGEYSYSITASSGGVALDAAAISTMIEAIR
ncbi:MULTISPECIES: hypothetical protein [unclassified Paenibacillus]|uniref:hypothetical protein n=1 Tax=unclassified Paenibacillus TaxID=185978 RepID=UPI0030FC63CD